MPDSTATVLQGLTNKHDEMVLRRALGNMAADLATIQAKHNALCAKLDLDAGVTDANYNTLTGIPSINTGT